MKLRSLLERFASLLALRLLPEWVVDAVMAGFLAWTWVDPFWAGPSVPHDLLPMLLFEFFAIHSTPLWILARAGRIPPWMLLLYVPFVIGAVLVFDSYWLAAFFLWHLAAAAWYEESTEEELALRILRYVVVGVIFLLMPVALWLFPVPELGWTPAAIPYDLAWEKSSGALVYAGLPAMLTIYFTLRSMWYAFWWHMARTGRLEARASR